VLVASGHGTVRLAVVGGRCWCLASARSQSSRPAATLRPLAPDTEDARPAGEQPAGPGGIHHGRTDRTEGAAAIACAAENRGRGRTAAGIGRAARGRAGAGHRAAAGTPRRILRIWRDTSGTSG
jgi:hypothetical protein